MKFQRSSGILLHPTSLPGPFGIGDLGPEAFCWVDFLSQSGVGLWQILPLGPTGYGDSPYQSFSAFAGNTLMVSPELLVKDKLLNKNNIESQPHFSKNKINFIKVKRWKNSIFQLAFNNFLQKSHPILENEYENFNNKQIDWLDDYIMYMAIKSTYQELPWNKWPAPLRFREKKALKQFRKDHRDLIKYHTFIQFLFFRQWVQLKKYVNKRNIKIIGDIPIFVAYDSSDVWALPHLFDLNKQLEPRVVAGVPPDYFSPTGQLWGNPHFRWDMHQRDDYQWWMNRIRHTLSLVDILRLDHFRGFGGYWEVPAGNPTAEHGRWVKGPGKSFFRLLDRKLGDLPLIAEDLGVITPDVKEMREQFQLPGMKILQFGFSTDATDPFLPHNYPVNCVAYTGTHDNETAKGWFDHATERERRICTEYLNHTGRHIAWDFIRAIWSSVAIFAIAPIQDFLELGDSARMNYPGRLGGNWNWRVSKEVLTPKLLKKIKHINILYRRDKARLEKEPPLSHLKYQKR